MNIVKAGNRERWVEYIQTQLGKTREQAEAVYDDPRRVREATRLEVRREDGAKEPVDSVIVELVGGELARPGKRSKPLPASSDHSSGLTVALDAQLGLSPAQLGVWLYLLRHAGKSPQRTLRLSYGVIAEALGWSRNRVLRAIPRLIELGLVVLREKGRPHHRGASAQVPLYFVPFPTSRRLDGWQAQATRAEAS
jgi:hypothetical protein